MNILFIAPEPPNHLNRIRTLNILKGLSKDHYIHFVCLLNSEEDRVYFDDSLYSKVTFVPLPKWQAYLNCLVRLPLPEPLEAAYCYSSKLATKVKQILKDESIDIIYVKRTRMARYGLDAPEGTTTILDLTDSMEMHYSRTSQTVHWYQKPLYYEEWFKYRLYERQMVAKYDIGVVASDVDRAYIMERVNHKKIFVLPNVVDTDFYFPVEREVNTPSVNLLFSGLMNKQVNIDGAKYLVEEIFPLIKQQVPNACLYIVGPKPPKEIRLLEKVFPDIIVTGYVTDIRDFLIKSTVVLVPIRAGAGTRNKILQAFSMQKPVVSTTVGAEGILGLSEENILIADDKQKFAAQVVSLLKNVSLQKKLGGAGRELVRKYYSVDTFRSELINMLQESNIVEEPKK